MMASTSQGSELDKLKEDLAAVREDIRALTDLYKDRARSEAENVSARLKQSAEKAKANLNERLQEGASAASEQIEARPFTSMLIAFGVGLAIGKLLERR